MKKERELEMVLKKMSDSYKRLCEEIKDRTVWNHIFNLIIKDGEISLEALRQSLVREIETSRSIKGECDPDHDKPRMEAEAALNYLDKIAPRPA